MPTEAAQRNWSVLGRITVILGVGLLASFVILGIVYGRMVGPSYFEMPRVSLIQLRDLLAQREALYSIALTLLGACALTTVIGLGASAWTRKPLPALTGTACAVVAPFLGLAIFVITALLVR
jgi:hypothetical protein